MNKDETPEYERDKVYLDHARSLITLFPIQIALVTEILSDVAVSF